MNSFAPRVGQGEECETSDYVHVRVKRK